MYTKVSYKRGVYERAFPLFRDLEKRPKYTEAPFEKDVDTQKRPTQATYIYERDLLTDEYT